MNEGLWVCWTESKGECGNVSRYACQVGTEKEVRDHAVAIEAGSFKQHAEYEKAQHEVGQRDPYRTRCDEHPKPKEIRVHVALLVDAEHVELGASWAVVDPK